MTDRLHIHDWDDHQTYRKDRGQPPWIKLYRSVLRNPKWVALTDAQRGQLTALWILAADDNGWIVDDSAFLKKMCCMDSEPDLDLFISHGFIDPRRHHDASVTPERRHHDAPEVETETETEVETDTKDLRLSGKPDVDNSLEDGLKWNARLAPLAREAGGESRVADWLKRAKPKPDYYEEVLIGLVSMRERGAIDFLVKPGEPMSPAILSISQEGQPIERRAIAEYERLGRMPKRTNGNMEHISVGGAGR